MTEKLVVKSLYKIFGDRPQEALALLEQGLGKDEIFERTHQTVGVCDANMTVAAGEIFVVMGLSGSGKSTLVRLFNRLIEPTAGEILIDGRDVARLSRHELIELRRRDMGMVFQSFALMPHLTVAENAAFGLDVAGIPKAERRERALAALDTVGLLPHADSRPIELSGGMQQRVGLARALCQDPSILLMDEAFSALDPLIRTEMQDELLRLQEKNARTVIFISHDLDEAMRIGDRIAIMEGGRIVQIGRPDEILMDPADHYVSSFFRGVDVSQVFTVGDIARKRELTIIHRPGDGVRAALNRLRRNESFYGYVLDRGVRFVGIVSSDSLEQCLDDGSEDFGRALLPDVEPLPADTLLGAVFSRVAESPFPLPVVDQQNKYQGVVTKAALLRTMDKTSEARRH